VHGYNRGIWADSGSGQPPSYQILFKELVKRQPEFALEAPQVGRLALGTGVVELYQLLRN